MSAMRIAARPGGGERQMQHLPAKHRNAAGLNLTPTKPPGLICDALGLFE
jgi:hypothetical protein